MLLPLLLLPPLLLLLLVLLLLVLRLLLQAMSYRVLRALPQALFFQFSKIPYVGSNKKIEKLQKT